MKDFEYFIKINVVKKQHPDINLAHATSKESFDRLEMAKSIINTQKPKYVLENAYESIRELIDSILYKEGFKSYSHEANVSYLLKIGFSIGETNLLDRMRKRRNGIKYYGEDATLGEANEALRTAEDLRKKILQKNPDLNKSTKD